MQQTANYNLNLPEGTDVVNPLVDYNPNFNTIDSAMKANADRTVGRATCVKSGTTHVVTRSNTGSNIINFTATGDWNTGDTMTIDSTNVSVFLPDGTAALDGAYVINSEVFGILNGTRFTLYGSQELPGYTASDVSYNNTGSGLTASDVQDAIDEVVAKFDRGSVSVTADGVKTLTQLFNELFALIDANKINGLSYIDDGLSVFRITYFGGPYLFTNTNYGLASVTGNTLTLAAMSSTAVATTIDTSNVTISNNSTYVPSAGRKYTLHY